MRRCTLAYAALCSLCSCAAELHRPTSGPCQAPNATQLLLNANNSLTFVDFTPGPAYDTAADGRARPLRLGPIAIGSKAVLSYPDPERFAGADAGFAQLSHRTFVYDQALALLWATQRGDRTLARGLAQTLEALQNQDGSWGFSFSAQGDGYYNAGYVRTGAVAWCLYALAVYQQRGDDPAALAVLHKGLNWLLLQVDSDTDLVLAGRGRWRNGAHFEPDWPAEFAATEHQIDAWFALMAAAKVPRIINSNKLLQTANRVAAASDNQLWREAQGRYAEGLANGLQDPISALDASGTWAALWDVARGRPERAERSLAWVEAHHRREVLGWPAYVPYVPGQPDTWFVEGSLAIALVWQRLGQPERARAALQPHLELACSGGLPLVYSPRWATDFPLAPAAAPTLWFAMVVGEVLGQPSLLWQALQP